MADSEAALPTLYNIAAGQDFLAALARGLSDEATRCAVFGACALEDVQILLPTRRAARQLASAFLAEALHRGRDAVLLPQIETLGDLDDAAQHLVENAEAFGAAHVDLPPAMEPMARHFHLLPLVAKWAALSGVGGTGGAGDAQTLNPVKLSALAYDLEGFLDQAQNEQIDLTRLPELVPDELAQNWQQTLALLNVVTQYWPQHLTETGTMDPTERRNALLADKRTRWAASPPRHPVIAAGSTGSIRATADLLKVIAHLPRGAVVLPGLDMAASGDLWTAIEQDVSHPQNMLARLIEHIGVSRDAIAAWPDSAPASARAALFNQALVPARQTAFWATNKPETQKALQHCHLIEAPDMRAEAGAIALVMREVLESQNKTAALVTRDRNLARRVAAELRRWGIEIDDSAGRPLGNLPGPRLLRLILACLGDDFEPVGLLALLKHPLVCFGRSRGAHLTITRQLENALLRGPKPADGLAGLHRLLSDLEPIDAAVEADIGDLLERLQSGFMALTDLPEPASLSARLQALMQVAGIAVAANMPTMAADALAEGRVILCADNEEGRSLADLLARLESHSDAAPPISAADFGPLMDMWMARQTVRQQTDRDPRLAILGPLEARLMQADVMILGGLNETVWPPMPETGPWLSRPMRAQLGMSQPERQIGQAAHDFVQAAAAAEVYLTRSMKIDGAPSIAARWVRRLETLCGALPRQRGNDLVQWWQQLDTASDIKPMARPQPNPPVSARPDSLSVTQIEKLLHNPFEIYAQKILHLRPLAPVALPSRAGHRGTFLHSLLEQHIAEGAHHRADAAAALLARADKLQKAQPGGSALMRFWQARLSAIADWLAAQEEVRAARIVGAHVELRGAMTLQIADAPFTLTAKADRIDRLKDNRFDIIDYKTGAVPSRKAVETHLAPQLTLEAAILRDGQYIDGADIVRGAAATLSYWHLTGRDPAGEMLDIDADAALLDGAVDMVTQLIAAYRHPAQAYHVHIRKAPSGQQAPLAERAFDHLARLPEWQNNEAET